MSDFAQQFFKELKTKFPDVSELLPKQELHAMLQAALRKMDLVTREEFDAQACVLLRTRERLEALEARLGTLQEKDS